MTINMNFNLIHCRLFLRVLKFFFFLLVLYCKQYCTDWVICKNESLSRSLDSLFFRCILTIYHTQYDMNMSRSKKKKKKLRRCCCCCCCFEGRRRGGKEIDGREVDYINFGRMSEIEENWICDGLTLKSMIIYCKEELQWWVEASITKKKGEMNYIVWAWYVYIKWCFFIMQAVLRWP